MYEWQWITKDQLLNFPLKIPFTSVDELEAIHSFLNHSQPHSITYFTNAVIYFFKSVRACCVDSAAKSSWFSIVSTTHTLMMNMHTCSVAFLSMYVYAAQPPSHSHTFYSKSSGIMTICLTMSSSPNGPHPCLIRSEVIELLTICSDLYLMRKCTKWKKDMSSH